MTNPIKRETVILIFDRNGKFYQIGFDLDRSQKTADLIRGSIKVVEGDTGAIKVTWDE